MKKDLQMLRASRSGVDLLEYQTTLKSRLTLSGVGVHTGTAVSIHFSPADSDTGIVFRRVDKGASGQLIRALAAEVGATDLCTGLGNPEGDHVATVEHLMAALSAMGVDNVAIEIDGPEVPIMDGSAAVFVEAFRRTGIVQLSEKRRYIRVVKPVRIDIGKSWAEFLPYDGTRFEIDIDFDSPAIGRQFFAVDLSPEIFAREVAHARTFGFIKDVERLWAAGYALGSSLENSVVIGEDHNVINMDGLRYPDEFVRHKMLDAVGDLALAGARFIGCFSSYRGGHRVNAAALRHLLTDHSAFEIVEATRRERGRRPEMIAVNAPVYAPWMI
ncbi:UDP-3-O-acyl-N-acetylglucosamine deacetylase [Chelativorans sp. Marseille-P2723]|uniref:UDP-3-O-acyl-N-acetylglucosamine deacetylase n=1 Tax=Chelativorans sp. Marseille-P2723 TaxID=2709133 RepID=UPI001FEE4805|nr:UDP-3-O-acyl-N-acetylglucosamine deacetylase [Chelativorans sp. Marseille-P2723]